VFSSVSHRSRRRIDESPNERTQPLPRWRLATPLGRALASAAGAAQLSASTLADYGLASSMRTPRPASRAWRASAILARNSG
jgi:hypothetical protein